MPTLPEPSGGSESTTKKRAEQTFLEMRDFCASPHRGGAGAGTASARVVQPVHAETKSNVPYGKVFFSIRNV